MPVDSIHDHEAARKIIELRSEISSLRIQVRTLEHALDRKLDRYDPGFQKLNLAVTDFRWWCAFLTAFLVAGAVAIIVVASKLP